MNDLPKVAIIDLGSQYTLVIERTVRELGFRSVILEPSRAAKWLGSHTAHAIILSGGEASVYANSAPQPPRDVLERGVPVLGICYGMQWIAHALGGTVKTVSGNREYGPAQIESVRESRLLAGTSRIQDVWASHGDSVTALPKDYTVTALSRDKGIAAMENETRAIYGVQFHPEVTHTPEGKKVLANFLSVIAHCEKDWKASSMVSQIQEQITSGLEDEEKAIFGFSGGVDSTVIARIAAPVLGDRLLAVTIDGGHLRENELDEIVMHANAAGVQHKIIDARADFEAVMGDTIDAETKRKRFKSVYASIFRKEAQTFGASVIFQGTLAPDRIESGATGGALIKSHHNVGLDFGNLKQAHPIDHFFKYEVRALARELDLPQSVYDRQPFPGPGLFLRVNGIPATQEKLEIVRWAEARVRETLEKHGVYKDLSQLIVHLLGVKMVGVKGDGRVYAYPIVVRAIRTIDFMTAKGVHFDEHVQDEISLTLTRHPEIVSVLFNPTDKPPATTEPE